MCGKYCMHSGDGALYVWICSFTS